MSLVIPAYNEEDRLGIMLSEAVDYLEQEYGAKASRLQNGNATKTMNGGQKSLNGHINTSPTHASTGWEVLLVSDGSTDKTIEIALKFARARGTPASTSIKVICLSENRGKGGAVTHGMRHVRGKYAVFADADGASKFEDLGKLVQACQQIEDGNGRGVAVGSRAHLVGSEAVVKVRVIQLAIIPKQRHPITNVASSALSSATFSCTPSTSFFGYSLPLPQQPSVIPNAASNSSLGLRYPISYLTCTPRAGFSTSRCSCSPSQPIFPSLKFRLGGKRSKGVN